MEGLQLYRHFCRQLKEMGTLRTAWFTTFNLDIGFFERHILAALQGRDYREIRNLRDYEALTEGLKAEGGSKDGGAGQMDVRVFHDYRMLMMNGVPKRTGVMLHPVEMKGHRKFGNSVFHPKVAAFENLEGQCWLLVTSANLTYGGWAHNRECFFLEQVITERQAEEVGQFFRQVIDLSIKDADERRQLKRSSLLRSLSDGARFRQRPGNSPDWSLVSSFDERHLLDQLSGGQKVSELTVWSPYFEKDMQPLAELLTDRVERLRLVPAKNRSGKIGLTRDGWDCLKGKLDVEMMEDVGNAGAGELFNHAKVWLSATHLGIGSWNMTAAGMGIDRQTRNVEAGVVIRLKQGQQERICQQLALKPLQRHPFMEEGEDASGEDTVDPDGGQACFIDLEADWDSRMIRMVYPKKLTDTYRHPVFRLPGMETDLKAGLLEDSAYPMNEELARALLKDRQFEFRDGRKALFRGYIREKNLAMRPANRFNHLSDLLTAWAMDEEPKDRKELQRPNYEEGDSPSVEALPDMATEDHQEWFTTFLALERMRRRLKDICEQKNASEKAKALKQLGHSWPGSLHELRMHLEHTLEMLKSDPDKVKFSKMYLWMVIQKTGHIIKEYNRQLKELRHLQIRPISAPPFRSLFSEGQWQDDEAMRKWESIIKKKLRE